MKYLKVCLCSICFLLLAQTVSADISSFCANKWPNDYQMREHCEKQQIEETRNYSLLQKSMGLFQMVLFNFSFWQ